MSAIHATRTSGTSLRQLVSNWLAIVVLLLVGVVWEPVFVAPVTNSSESITTVR